MYNTHAKELRQCRAIKKDGSPCTAWALWNSNKQVCFIHSERPREHCKLDKKWPFKKKARVPSCKCEAYAWPHRPGGGLCEWPLKPKYICLIPEGTHFQPRLRLRSKKYKLW